MNRIDFEETWIKATKILSKRTITSEYIKYNAEKMGVESWDEKIVKEIFEELCSADPFEVKLDANSIKSAYWNRYRISKGSIVDNDPKPCRQLLCDGKGIVRTKKKVPGYSWLFDYVWRCPCVLGVNVHHSVPIYNSERAKELGHAYLDDPNTQPYTQELHTAETNELDSRELTRHTNLVFNHEINRLIKTKGVLQLSATYIIDEDSI